MSGYRSYPTQVQLYNRYAARDGKKLQINIAHVLATQNIKQVLHLTSVALIQIKLICKFRKTKEGQWIAKTHINTALS